MTEQTSDVERARTDAITALRYLACHPRPIGGQDRFNAMHLLDIADRLASPQGVNAERLKALDNVVNAWDSLRTGNYDRDIIETWLADKMKPAIEGCRSVAAEGLIAEKPREPQP